MQISRISRWLIVLCCMVLAIGDNNRKALGCLEAEKIGLLKLKHVLNHYNKNVPSTWGDELVKDCCTWEGVICDEDHALFSKRIVNLSITTFDMNHDLQNPDEWFLDASLFQPFEELQNLTFHDSPNASTLRGFKGRVRLTKLQVLDLSNNGAMSHDMLMGELPSLKFLDLSYNYMSTAFPDLTNMSGLELLNLRGDVIEGSIPSSIWALASLKMLGLSLNLLNGTLPERLCTLTNLEELDLSENEFVGVLPACLSNLTSLRLLDLSENQFTGKIPSNLFSGLQSLQYVSLSHNLFDGLFSFTSLENNSKIEVFRLENYNPMLKVDTENTKWKPQLKIFVLSNCILNEASGGIIPSFLLTQYDLRFVNLSSNGMNGDIPTWLLTNNSKLEDLRLNNNSFSGSLLLQLGSYNAYMRWFDISMNHVAGEIPTFIGSILPNLIHINMSTNLIEGGIPSSIQYMRELIKLDLSNNHIYGEIPEDLFYGCEKLLVLKLSNNNLTTFLPLKSPRLPLITSLLVLDVSYNLFTGRFPDLITELSSLRNLVLSENYFEGKLPVALCNLKHLAVLDLSGNNFADTLPPCTRMLSLSHLHLQGNKFQGPLPNFLSKSSSLMLLDVSNNKFSGLIPAWISSFPDLTFLLLSGNIFHGLIPSQLCHLENLNFIDLAGNNFTGSIPPCLFHIPIGKSAASGLWFDQAVLNLALSYEGDYTYKNSSIDQHLHSIINFWPESNEMYFDITEQVQFITKSMSRSYRFNTDTNILLSGIDLSLNKLTGPIPVDIDNWENVYSLNLSNNYLNGQIPWTLSRLQLLESLDLSHNMLSGKIPSQMSNLTSLEVFSVAYNNLSGPTPTMSNQFGTFDSSSYEGNPLLCGPPLVKSCGGGPTKMPHEKASAEPEQSDSNLQNRVFVEFYWIICGVMYRGFSLFLLWHQCPPDVSKVDRNRRKDIL